MKMSEAFATTIAGVAPVILLVAAVEIGNRKEALREGYHLIGQRQRLIDELYAAPEAPTGLQLQAVAAQTDQPMQSATRDLFIALYVMSALIVGVLLLLAESLALVWLAGSQRGSHPLQAAFCLLALVIGFAWVMLAPMLGLVVAVADDAVVVISGVSRLRRFYRDLDTHDRQQQAADGEQT
ncbi:hypothetical protein ACFWIJ_15055 [Streptomyces sp. NPDC127079]|uniref:hypothetical protein n=1 Tax=Streptomyces sp. NPDC127079 TaxID=3347132 RepID=UPI00364A34CF